MDGKCLIVKRYEILVCSRVQKKGVCKCLSRSSQFNCLETSAWFFFMVDQLLGYFIERNKFQQYHSHCKWRRYNKQLHSTIKNVTYQLAWISAVFYCVAMVFMGIFTLYSVVWLLNCVCVFFRETLWIDHRFLLLFFVLQLCIFFALITVT